MVSYRRYIFIVEFFNIFLLIMVYYLLSYIKLYQIVLIQIFVIPFFKKLFIAEGRKSLEFIYLNSFYIFLAISPAFIIVKASNIY
jgi:hypothetical protein